MSAWTTELLHNVNVDSSSGVLQLSFVVCTPMSDMLRVWLQSYHICLQEIKPKNGKKERIIVLYVMIILIFDRLVTSLPHTHP